MTGCHTCGGGMGKHDPVAHDQVPEDDEPCMCGHDDDRHGPEAGGCIECRCTVIPAHPCCR